MHCLCGRCADAPALSALQSSLLMHELSIVTSVVEAVTESLQAQPGISAQARVTEVRLRVGALASVVRESLEFCYGLATEDTPLAGSRLVIEEQPVILYCSACQREAQRESVHLLRCPLCGRPSNDLRAGRELEIASYEVDDEPEGIAK